MMPIKDLTGQKFGMLTARWIAGRTKKTTYWLCSCECGKLSLVRQGNLTSGMAKSCGCRRGNFVHGKTGTVEYLLWKQARRRSIKKNISFNIKVEDIVIPEKCPLLGIPLYRGSRLFHDNSPSIDRKIPENGYMKENIRVISFRANLIKNNATLEEMKLIVKNWEKK